MKVRYDSLCDVNYHLFFERSVCSLMGVSIILHDENDIDNIHTDAEMRSAFCPVLHGW